MPFNIANDDDLKTKLAAAAAGIDDERLSKWVVKRFFSLASETEALLVPFTPATARDWPDWVLRRMEEGADLRLFPEAGGSEARVAFDARLASCAAFLAGMVDLSREEPAAGPAGDRRRRDVAAPHAEDGRRRRRRRRGGQQL